MMDDDDDIYMEHQGAKMLFEAMMYAGGFSLDCRERRYSTSPELSPIRKNCRYSQEYRKGEKQLFPCERFQGKKTNYYELANKNANELIREEEQAKMKAIKKKNKKERQKMKKQNEQENSVLHNNDNLTSKISSELENLNIASVSDNKEAQELDIEAAFVGKAIKKLKKGPTPIISNEKVKQEVKDINVLIKKSQEYEKKQHYKEAVQYISDAINLKPQKVDLILKRSFLYFELAKFEKSVRDAKKAIQYDPNNPHGYYRLGEGHFALSNLMEAEAAFTKLLTLNSYCDEAKDRLFSIRIKQLEEMGYHPNEAFAALTKSKNKTLDEALDFLRELEEGKHTDELYYSDEDEDEDDYEDEESSNSASGPSTSSSGNSFTQTIEINNKSPILTDPKNPLRCNSLFVGSLKKDITYEELENVFIRFGDIKSIKLSTDSSCYAFVNYEDPVAAGQAMLELQGSRWLLSTTPLVIRYPINVIRNLIPNIKNPEMIMNQLAAAPPAAKKPTPVKSVTYGKQQIPVVQKPEPGKPRPPPKTEECFYWRTMGCSYGDKCFNLHVPAHRGIDMKPPKKPFLKTQS